ncbi:MAG: DUF4396 domain-containing protein [Bryobacteraceae bacterium]
MAPRWIHVLAFVYLAVSVACAIWILGDILNGRKQRMAVMNAVWPITALYFGPIGLWSYWRLGRPATEDSTNKKPFWQSVFVGATHCGAGCSVGDFVAEWAVFASGATLAGAAIYANFLWDFIAAYILGIAFQYFSIVPMRHLSFAEGIKEAVKADTVSLVAFEIGMFVWMALTSEVFFSPPLHPDSAVYWFMMQIAMMVGFCTAYPANWLLIRKGVKTGM